MVSLLHLIKLIFPHAEAYRAGNIFAVYQDIKQQYGNNAHIVGLFHWNLESPNGQNLSILDCNCTY